MKYQQGILGLKTLHRGNWDCIKKKKMEQREWLNQDATGDWQLDDENHRWDEEERVHVGVWVCMSLCMQAAQPSQNCRRKGNELGEKKTGQKISGR